MITLKEAIVQAKALGATRYAINYMDRSNKRLEFSFVHFFNDNNLEIGYLTMSLIEFTNKISTFTKGRKWDDYQFNHTLEDWTKI